MEAHAYDSSWHQLTDIYAYDGTDWQEIIEGWVYDGTDWQQFWGSSSSCSSISSVGSDTFSERGCLDPKCRTCVWWTLDCTCVAGQGIDIFRSLSGGSYVSVVSGLSCTNSAFGCTPPGSPDGHYEDSYCSAALRRHRIELMDTDGTTTLDTAYTGNIGCGEA